MGRAGECALHVPEKLRLRELAGNRRAIESHERPLGTAAPGVHERRDQLLPGPRLSAHEDRDVLGRNLRDRGDQSPHGHRLPDDRRDPACASGRIRLTDIGACFEVAHRSSLDDLVLVEQYDPAWVSHGRFGRPPEARRRTAYGCGPATASAAWPPGLPGDLQRLEGLDRSCSYVTHRRANGGRHVAHRWRKPDLVVRG